MTHKPVLPKEVLEYLDPKPNENFIDCTVGQGGHARLILEKTAPKGVILGIDQDPKQIENCRKQLHDLKERIVLVNSSYANLKKIVEENRFGQIHGILIDLGMSSWQLEESGRGFSFLKDEPLIMAYNQEGLTAEQILNKWPAEDLEFIFENYGEERFSKRIARKIIEARKIRPIETTFQLVEIIRKSMPTRYQFGKIHFATRVFQALRIATNNELENLKNVLPQITEVLESGARLAVISFHSAEDRIVKNFLKEKSKENIIKILTKKPITAGSEEIAENPRSRSAKLRSAIKL
jgi:16S rRNA (cytosine1402-N4)-methyltransferase